MDPDARVDGDERHFGDEFRRLPGEQLGDIQAKAGDMVGNASSDQTPGDADGHGAPEFKVVMKVGESKDGRQINMNAGLAPGERGEA